MKNVNKRPSLILDCGGWPVEFRFPRSTSGFREKIGKRYSFLLTEVSPQAVLEVSMTENKLNGHETDTIVLDTRSPAFEFSSPAYHLVYDIVKKQGQVVFKPSRPGTELSLLNTVLEVFIGVKHVLSGTGILIHAAAVKSEQSGWIFPGRSGAGKTTLAKSFPDEALVNDETVLIRLNDNGGVSAWNVPLMVPLRGKVKTFDLAGIVFLERHESPLPGEAQAQALSPARIAARLIPHTLPPSMMFCHGSRDAWLEQVLTVCINLASSRPGFLLPWYSEFPAAARSFIEQMA
jgi:hypothetical protein